MTTLHGTLGVWYWFLPPSRSFVIRDRTDAYALLGFVIFSAAIIALGESNRGVAARSRLAAIVDSSGDAIISTNLDGIVTSWNKSAERVFGYTADEAPSQHITLIIPLDRRDEETMNLEGVSRGEQVERCESVRVFKDGAKLDVSLTISPIQDATGRLVGVSRVTCDIMQRRQAEKVKRQSELSARLLQAKVLQQTGTAA